jgi:hypothetical protein
MLRPRAAEGGLHAHASPGTRPARLRDVLIG